MDQDGGVLVPANANDFSGVGGDVISQGRQLFQEVEEGPGVGGASGLAPVGVLEMPNGSSFVGRSMY